MNPVDYFTSLQAGPGWQAILQSFQRFIKLPPAAIVLDAGTGPGLLARMLTAGGHTVTGVDLDPGMIRRARELATHLDGVRPTFEVADVQHLRFADHSFEAALATNVVFLVPNPQQAVHELTRVVRPGGLVAMLNPSDQMSLEAATALADERNLTGVERASLINWGRAAEYHRRFTRQQATDLFAAAGLTEIEHAEKVGPGLARFTRGRRPHQ